MTYELTTRAFLPRPIGEVFAFFGDAENLEAITPPGLRFEILTPRPIRLCAGAKLDYRIRLHGLPIRWRTEIETWEPPVRFVDRQLAGPYRLWRHEHSFEEVDGGTLATDRVLYALLPVPGVHRFLVAPDLRRIFTYRLERIRARFGGEVVGTEAVRIRRLPAAEAGRAATLGSPAA